MDALAVTASGQSFRVSRALLKKHSRYFEQRLGEGSSEKAVDLPGIPAEAFSVLVSYFSKPELNIAGNGSRSILAAQEAACALGVTAFPQDLAKALKSSWSSLADVDTVFTVAARLGIHSQMVRTVVEDVLALLLSRNKETCGLRESALTYEILIFATRLDLFWETLYERCQYFFDYEHFFEAVVGWMVKRETREANVVSLVDSLRIHTVSFKFLSDCVANATGIADTKEQLKFVLQRKQEAIAKSVCDNLHQVRLSWYDASQGNVTLHALSAEKFGWDVIHQFTRSPLDTDYSAVSEDYAYAMGDQTLTSVRIQGGVPVIQKYPERLQINYCYAHASSLFCFAWNTRDHVLYEFNSERRKFVGHGTVPVDGSLVATALGKKLFVLGEILHSSVKSNQLKVFKYHLEAELFSWVAILKKTWCQPELTGELLIEEAPTTCKNHLVVAGEKMFAFVQEFSSSIKSKLYYYEFQHDSNNCSEIYPRNLDSPVLMDRHTVLVGLHDNPRGIAMLFRSSYKGEYSLSLLPHGKDEMTQLGFLPHFAQASLVSAEYVWLRYAVETVPKTSEEHNSNNLQATEAGSVATLVADENDLSQVKASAENVQYRSPRREDLAEVKRSSDVPDGFRPLSRRSSVSSGFSSSSRASRRSKKGSSKKSIASRAVSVVASLVR